MQKPSNIRPLFSEQQSSSNRLERGPSDCPFLTFQEFQLLKKIWDMIDSKLQNSSANATEIPELWAAGYSDQKHARLKELLENPKQITLPDLKSPVISLHAFYTYSMLQELSAIQKSAAALSEMYDTIPCISEDGYSEEFSLMARQHENNSKSHADSAKFFQRLAEGLRSILERGPSASILSLDA